MNRISKIACFVIFSALLTSGFPNFMIQEAHAAPTYTAKTGDSATGDSTATTKILVSFDNPVFTELAGGVTTGWSISNAGGASFSSITAMEVTTLAGTCTGGGTSSITITLDQAIATDALPTVTYAAGTPIYQCSDDTQLAGASIAATDGLSPTVSSVTTTSTTTIDVTFSEDIDDATDVAADFAVTSPAATVDSTSVSGSVVTLTLNSGTPITDTDTPTVTLQNTGVDDDDGNTINSGATVATSGFSTASSGGGSGCNGDCEEPTLGVLPNGQRVVDDGFTYNGHAVDVERFFTPYPLITAQVGKQNTAQFKIYENRGPDNIAHFDFAFGLGKDQIISDSKAMIEVDFTRDRTHTVNIVDPENALDNVSVTTDIVACNGGPTQCLEITINHMFREPLDFDIVGTNVWDYSRQSWQNYYNHGIEVVGPSLNPAETHDGVNQGHIYHLTETSKMTAVDEFGDSWTFQYGKWMKDYIKQERVQDGDVQVFDRMHSDFTSYKANLSDEAFNQLTQMCPLCVEQYADFDDSTSWEYGNKISKLSNPETKRMMELESQKAQEILKYIMDPKLSSTEKYKALVELEKDDRPISEILAEERMMKDILQAERHWLKQVIAPNQ